ncbi:MAG: helix-turn-helix transcriptional regulator [Oscillospiraceae bacterium]|nr:helix-turn-helix transcriptional regulator [Oscillospiraceae bacterium]
MLFCEKLRILIEDNNFTQKQVAEDMQIPASTLGGYVQGTSEPDFETLKMIAKYFKVSTDYLLDYNVNAVANKEDELIKIFRTLSPKQQDLYIEQGKVFEKLK